MVFLCLDLLALSPQLPQLETLPMRTYPAFTEKLPYTVCQAPDGHTQLSSQHLIHDSPCDEHLTTSPWCGLPTIIRGKRVRRPGELEPSREGTVNFLPSP